MRVMKASSVGAIIVNRKTLVEACEKTRHVSRRLHQLEVFAELSEAELNALCRNLHQTEMLLQAMLDAGDEALSLAF
jgi:hypothetical protein